MKVSFRQHLKLFHDYLKPQAAGVLLLATLLAGGIALQLANPQVIRRFIDTAQVGGSSEALMAAAVLFIALSLAQRGLALAADVSAGNVGWTATNALRRDLFLHSLRLDLSFHKVHTPGELIERIDGDVTALSNYFSQFILQILSNALLVAGILILLYREDVRIGAGLTVYTLAALILLASMQRLAVPRWKAARQSNAQLYGFIEERISGAEEIRASGGEPYVMFRLYHLMRDFLITVRAAFVVDNLLTSLTHLLFALGYTIGLGLGISLYIRGEASIGTAYLIVYYIGMLAWPLDSIQQQARDYQQAAAGLQRVQELLNIQPAVQEPFSPVSSTEGRLPRGPLAVEFRNVSFGYREHEPEDNHTNTLEAVSFTLQPGRVLGVLGRTGSGKSTLTRLLFRLYDPASGAICLSGVDLRDLPLAELRARVGMVTQDVQLFQASLRENLALFNKDIREEQIYRALRELRLLDWAKQMPEGLDTFLAAGGQGLSAGEAQLLAFTRVFLKDPSLVILDEASSRLDPVTEALLEQAIDRLFLDRTGILIAHRLQTVQRANEILILEGGRVVEYGPRLELASDPGSRFFKLLKTGLEEALA